GVGGGAVPCGGGRAAGRLPARARAVRVSRHLELTKTGDAATERPSHVQVLAQVLHPHEWWPAAVVVSEPAGSCVLVGEGRHRRGACRAARWAHRLAGSVDGGREHAVLGWRAWPG